MAAGYLLLNESMFILHLHMALKHAMRHSQTGSRVTPGDNEYPYRGGIPLEGCTFTVVLFMMKLYKHLVVNIVGTSFQALNRMEIWHRFRLHA